MSQFLRDFHGPFLLRSEIQLRWVSTLTLRGHVDEAYRRNGYLGFSGYQEAEDCAETQRNIITEKFGLTNTHLSTPPRLLIGVVAEITIRVSPGSTVWLYQQYCPALATKASYLFSFSSDILSGVT